MKGQEEAPFILDGRPFSYAGRRVLNVQVKRELKMKSALSLVVPSPCCFDPVRSPLTQQFRAGRNSQFPNRLEGQFRVAVKNVSRGRHQ